MKLVEILAKELKEWPEGGYTRIVQTTREFDPIYCRDRIKEIDALVESLEEERVSLVQALEDEGFMLVSTALVSAVIDKAIVRASKVEEVKEDMTDPANWQKGDLIICLKNYESQFTMGEVYTVSKSEPEEYVDVEQDDEGDPNGYPVYCFKWHSRPTTVNH